MHKFPLLDLVVGVDDGSGHPHGLELPNNDEVLGTQSDRFH